MPKKRKILVAGSGGREAVLAWKFAQDPNNQVFCAPGNAGIWYAECVPIGVMDFPGLIGFAKEQRIDLIVVGPEGPLCAGLGDCARQAGLLTLGPSKMAAQAEGSKDGSRIFSIGTISLQHHLLFLMVTIMQGRSTI